MLTIQGFKNPVYSDKTLSMSKDYTIFEKIYSITIEVPNNINPEYPTFFINTTEFFLHYPHIDRSKDGKRCSICLINNMHKKYFSSAPKLIKVMLKLLEQYLNDIMSGKFTSIDVYNEFEDNWCYPFHINGTTYRKIASFNSETILQDVETQKITMFTGLNNSFLPYLAGNKKERILSFVKRGHIKILKSCAIFIRIEKYFPDKIPEKLSDFRNILQKNEISKDLLKAKYSLVLFSFIIPHSEKLHFASFEVDNKIALYKNIFQNVYDGPIIGYSTNDISNKRIFTRGSDVLIKGMDLSSKVVTIVGCGSVGASVAFKLIKSGLKNLKLIDPDNIYAENIGRHILGIEYINMSKTHALKKFLDMQFQDLNIKSEPSHAQNNMGILKDSDLIISALGNDAPEIENMLILDSINGNLPAVISCWFEAGAAVGHCVYFDAETKKHLNNSTFNMFEMFKKLYYFKDEYAKTLLKDDVGCNSTYMPYSFINADIHNNHFSTMAIKCLLGKTKYPIWSSYGDLEGIAPENVTDSSIQSNILLKKDYIDVFKG